MRTRACAYRPRVTCVQPQGLEPLAGAADGETHTKGLEGLEANCREYARAGAKFAKWRATLKVRVRRNSGGRRRRN